MALSIFSFEKRRVRNSGSGKISRSEQSSVTVLDAPEEEHSSSTMLLDLEHLTPEVMDAFFPSESTLPTPAPRNPAKRRGAFSR